MRQGFINNFKQELDFPLTETAEEMILKGGGDLFRFTFQGPSEEPMVYTLTLFDDDQMEVVTVTGAESGESNKLKIERGKEGTTAKAWDAGTSVQMRLTADFLNRVAVRDTPVLLGGSSMTPAESDEGIFIGDRLWSSAVNPIAIGYNLYPSGDKAIIIGTGCYAGGEQSVTIGSGSRGDGDDALSLGTDSAARQAKSVAIGYGSSANGDSAISMGVSSLAGSEKSIAIGEDARSLANGTIAIGGGTTASSEDSIAIGSGSQSNPPSAVSVGASTRAGSPYSTALGTGASARFIGSIVLGAGQGPGVPGSFHANALPVMPASPSEANSGAPSVTRRATNQVCIQTEVIDLADDQSMTELAMPSDTILLIDSLDFVVTESEDAEGSPEIKVGTDESENNSLLAATEITQTDLYGRQTFTPAHSNGVTSIQVSVASAGTGKLKGKLIVRGYVMEV